MPYCIRCGTELPDSARFCARCGAAKPPVAAVSSAGATEPPVVAPPAPRGAVAPRPWLPVVAVVVGLILVLAGFLVGPAIFGSEDTRGEDVAEASSGDSGEPGEDAGWTIAYVTDSGIETRSEEGDVTRASCPSGPTADWSPDRTRVAMLSYGRNDLAYVDGFTIVAYPDGTVIRAGEHIQGGYGMIEYYGWLPDSSAIEWGDLDGGYYRVDAGSGATAPIADTTDPTQAPSPPEQSVLEALEAAVVSVLDPPASEGTMVNIVQVLPSADGAALLVDVAVWRNTHLETAAMYREVAVWMANADGSGARKVATGHSPAWIEE